MRTAPPSATSHVVLRVAAARVMRRRDQVRAVRDLLRHQLLHSDGANGAHALLPSEDRLAQEYCTGRNVIRLALAALQDEGVVRRVQGSGTFSQAKKLKIRRDRLECIAQAIERTGPAITYEPQLVEYRPAPEAVAHVLDLPLGSEVAVIERKSYYNAQPCSLNTRYLSADVAKRMLDGDLATGDWIGALEAASGLRVTGGRAITEAVLADALVAPDLGLPVGAPVLLRHVYTYATTGRVLEFAVSRMRGDLVEIETWSDR